MKRSNPDQISPRTLVEKLLKPNMQFILRADWMMRPQGPASSQPFHQSGLRMRTGNIQQRRFSLPPPPFTPHRPEL